MSDHLTSTSATTTTIPDAQKAAARAYLLVRHLRGDLTLDEFTDIGTALDLWDDTDDQPRLGHVHGTKRRAEQKHRARTAKGVRHA